MRKEHTVIQPNLELHQMRSVPLRQGEPGLKVSLKLRNGCIVRKRTEGRDKIADASGRTKSIGKNENAKVSNTHSCHEEQKQFLIAERPLGHRHPDITTRTFSLPHVPLTRQTYLRQPSRAPRPPPCCRRSSRRSSPTSSPACPPQRTAPRSSSSCHRPSA